MAYLVSIQQAACNALQVWLQSQLTPGGPSGVSVEPRWPDPEKPLPTAGAVTILMTSGADVVLVDPAVTSKIQLREKGHESRLAQLLGIDIATLDHSVQSPHYRFDPNS